MVIRRLGAVYPEAPCTPARHPHRGPCPCLTATSASSLIFVLPSFESPTFFPSIRPLAVVHENTSPRGHPEPRQGWSARARLPFFSVSSVLGLYCAIPAHKSPRAISSWGPVRHVPEPHRAGFQTSSVPDRLTISSSLQIERVGRWRFILSNSSPPLSKLTFGPTPDNNNICQRGRDVCTTVHTYCEAQANPYWRQHPSQKVHERCTGPIPTS